VCSAQNVVRKSSIEGLYACAGFDIKKIDQNSIDLAHQKPPVATGLVVLPQKSIYCGAILFFL